MPDLDPTALRALLDAATPGPWTQGGTPTKPHWFVYGATATVHGPRFPETQEDYTDSTVARWNADAALIVAAVNALPALLDEREALLARIAELEYLLRHLVAIYGLEHPNGCKTCDQAAALVTPEDDHDPR